jgi:hypothetical protein
MTTEAGFFDRACGMPFMAIEATGDFFVISVALGAAQALGMRGGTGTIRIIVTAQTNLLQRLFELVEIHQQRPVRLVTGLALAKGIMPVLPRRVTGRALFQGKLGTALLRMRQMTFVTFDCSSVCPPFCLQLFKDFAVTTGTVTFD